jgi:acetyl esterase/lipase
LRDEDIRYHELMQEAGFDSELMHFPDMVHAFINMENLCLEQCAKMYGRVGEFAKA